MVRERTDLLFVTGPIPGRDRAETNALSVICP